MEDCWRLCTKESDEKLEERNKEFVINLSKKGVSIAEIARIVEVSEDFVKKTLSK